MAYQKPFRILVVDDDMDILELLQYNLSKEGFKVKILCDSHNAVDTACKFLPDLIILDLMMPHPNGIEICRTLRSMTLFSKTHIFFLTAKSENYYQEAALDTGGDDFIEKVMGLRALTYKVRSVLKEHFVIRKSVRELKVGDLIIRRKSASVKIHGRDVILSKPEFELLFFFAQNPGKRISLENLLSNIWGSEMYLFDTSIDTYIHNLRQKLGRNLIRATSANEYLLEMD